MSVEELVLQVTVKVLALPAANLWGVMLRELRTNAASSHGILNHSQSSD